MLVDVSTVEIRDDYKLLLRFDDDTEGVVDIERLIGFKGVFEPLRDPAFFKLVRVDRELGTICWPNGADICPDVLYAEATGTKLPKFAIVSKEVQVAEDSTGYHS